MQVLYNTFLLLFRSSSSIYSIYLKKKFMSDDSYVAIFDLYKKKKLKKIQLCFSIETKIPFIFSMEQRISKLKEEDTVQLLCSRQVIVYVF